jgi:ribosome maturation factor RimP
MGGFFQPIFFGRSTFAPSLAAQRPAAPPVNVQASIETTVTGLGFELVEVERAPRGLLRVFIDRVPGHSYPAAQGVGEFVTVDDCEAVTRQLQVVLEVEGAEYARLEVSSPGLDRPLKREADFERFVGAEIELTLKQAFQGRKHWRGVLAGQASAWQLELRPPAPPPRRPGAGQPRKVATAPEQAQALGFALDEVREARLVPVVDFKGRSQAAAAVPSGEKSA